MLTDIWCHQGPLSVTLPMILYICIIFIMYILSWHFCLPICMYIFIYILVGSRRWGCLVTWFCYHLITKPGDKTVAPSWPDPYICIYIYIYIYIMSMYFAVTFITYHRAASFFFPTVRHPLRRFCNTAFAKSNGQFFSDTKINIMLSNLHIFSTYGIYEIYVSGHFLWKIYWLLSLTRSVPRFKGDESIFLKLRLNIVVNFTE